MSQYKARTSCPILGPNAFKAHMLSGSIQKWETWIQISSSKGSRIEPSNLQAT